MPKSSKTLKTLQTLHGNINLPAFFPDATYGKIKGLESKELLKCKVDGVVVNAYHIFKNNLLGKISKIGIHKYMKFNKPIISDSGGFQVMSLIHNHKNGKILNKGAFFTLNNKKILLTPEKCIQLQLKIKSDIIMCLDECTMPDISFSKQKESVGRTINWARRCKKYFDKKTKNMRKKPLLFAIVQGGNNKRLRRYCAQQLIKLNFDGYSFGGFPIKNKKLLTGILRYVAELLPDDKPKYAMGIGKPDDIIKCVKMGYNLFDCVIPTRDARHKRLYVWKDKKKLKHSTLNIRTSNKKIRKLANLFKTDYALAVKRATMHNLGFYGELMNELRKKYTD